MRKASSVFSSEEAIIGIEEMLYCNKRINKLPDMVINQCKINKKKVSWSNGTTLSEPMILAIYQMEANNSIIAYYNMSL